MISKLKALLIDRSLLIFLVIGVFNTLLNWALMLVLYNNLHLNYWASSAIGFLITSALSFVLNRRFSFQSKGNWQKELVKFAVVIAICYLVGYTIAKPLVLWVLRLSVFKRFSPWADQIALIAGNVIFTALNYFGQRFFAFNHEPTDTK